MKTIAKLLAATGAVLFLSIGTGCGDGTASPVSCDVPPTAVIGYEDCVGLSKDGHHCFEDCGIADFSPNPPPAASMVGCLVGQAETPALALCVASCSECSAP